MSNFNQQAFVVPVELEKHPNPEIETLSVVKIWNYQVVVKTEEWIGKDKGVYLVPDTVVPDRPEWEFLNGSRRIKVRKFGKEPSQGLLIPAPEGSQIGDDVSQQLGISRYISAEERRAMEDDNVEPFEIPWQLKLVPTYSVENWYRYGSEVFEEGEEVYITEKIHGSNIRITYHKEDDTVFVGSHYQWRRPGGGMFWDGVNNNNWLIDFVKQNDDFVVYGEIYGLQKNFPYDTYAKQCRIKIFDVYSKSENKFLSFEETYNTFDVLKENWVPVMYIGNYVHNDIRPMADGETLVEFSKQHIREGIVVSSIDSSRKLKVVSNNYYMKQK